MVAELLIDFLCGAKERPPFEAPENQVKSLKKNVSPYLVSIKFDCQEKNPMKINRNNSKNLSIIKKSQRGIVTNDPGRWLSEPNLTLPNLT